ncbi:MAG: DnaD domain protein [Eubacteriales bacterium]|nr:DnaD domain protein [Eubacteriales bacterium]
MGTFTVYQNSNADTTAISNLFIDEYMSGANDAQIKIYLYLARMMRANLATTISEMADQFNHTEKEVLRSLKYWEKQGLLSLDYAADNSLCGIHLCELHTGSQDAADDCALSITPMETQSAAPEPLRPTLVRSAAARRETAESVSTGGYVQRAAAPRAAAARPLTRTAAGEEERALAAFRSDAGRAQLLFIIEQYVGKPLSVAELRAIYHMSADLHFSDDLIDYLVQYCIDRGKKDFRYITRVAANWAENGITTPQQAESRQSVLRQTPVRSGRARAPRSNKFNQFEQNSYDFDELERELLSN